MPAKFHVDPSYIQQVVSRFLDYVPLKAVGTAFLAFISWMFEGKAEVLGVVYILILFDTVTGLAIAWKQKSVASRGFFQVAVKCLVYFILILTGRLVDKVVPVPFASTIMESFLVITEAISIMENLGKLNFPVPLGLIKRMKVFTKEK